MFSKKFNFVLAASLMLAACGGNSFSSMADKNSSAAKKEDAQIAVNGGNYDAAIGLMAEKCPNKTCTTKSDTQLYAAAYMGKAGLDVLTVAKNADSSKNNTSSSSSDFAVISKGIPSPTAANLDDIASAITILKNSQGAMGLSKPSFAAKSVSVTYTSEQKDFLLQLGISQATATILAVGSQLGGFDDAGLPNDCELVAGKRDCSTAASQNAIATALNAVYVAPTSYADFAAASLIDGSANLLKAFSGDNSTAGAINNMASSIQYHTHGNSDTCNWKVVSSHSATPDYEVLNTDAAPYVPSFDGARLISYLQTCLK